MNQPDPADLINAWGRVTEALGLPWGASTGKVVEEIRGLRNYLATCRHLAAAAPQGDCSVNGLFERLAEIEKVARMDEYRHEI